jgi:hypothetical protein
VAHYADNPAVQIVAIEYGASSTLSLIQSWIASYGWTFPVGVNNQDNRIYNLYGFDQFGYDTFFVIDAQGTVTLIEGYGNSTADFPRLEKAIDDALATVPVRPATWGRIKRLYGDR